MKKLIKNPLVLKLPLLLYSMAIFYMSHQSQPPNIVNYFWSMDKLLHLGAYFVYFFCSLLYFKTLKFPAKKMHIYSITIALLFAISDEFHQYFIPGRSAEFGDILADFVGIFLAFSIYYFVNKKLKKQSEIK